MRTAPRTWKTAPEAWLPDAWIIEEELRREREQQDRDRPYLELPLQMPEPFADGPSNGPEEPPRGVLILDI